MNLRSLRKRLKISQPKLCELSGVKQATISKIELAQVRFSESGEPFTINLDTARKLVYGLNSVRNDRYTLDDVFPEDAQRLKLSDSIGEINSQEFA